MFVLGLHGNLGRAEHDPAAVLLRDGRIVAAVE
jgi:predicted NodU family carbamoyl transferase